MSNILVTPEQLGNIATQLNSGAGEIQSILSRLASLVAPLNGDWKGQAQVRFEQLWQEWQTSAAGLHEALTGISQLTQGASTSYADTEAAIASSFGR